MVSSIIWNVVMQIRALINKVDIFSSAMMILLHFVVEKKLLHVHNSPATTKRIVCLWLLITMLFMASSFPVANEMELLCALQRHQQQLKLIARFGIESHLFTYFII